MENKKLQCVIFDMDGCLVDSESIYLEGWKHAFETKNIPVDETIINSWVGRSWEYTKAEIYKITNDDEMTMEIRQMRLKYFFDALYSGKVSLKEYAKELIVLCKNNQLKVGLASSSFSDYAIPIMKYFDLYDYFDFLVFGDNVKSYKPAPDSYLLAVEKSGVEKESCLVFEDSKSGVTAAIRAGLRVVYVPDIESNEPFSHPEIYRKIETLKQAVPIVEELLSGVNR